MNKRTAAHVLGLTLLAVLGIAGPATWAGETGTITPARLAELIPSAGASLLVIDLRPADDYMAGTVAGALHGEPDPGEFVPPGDVREAVLLPPDDDHTGVADAWVERLASLGLRVMLLEGDPDAWRAAGVALQRPGPPSYADPGSVPFVVPRGICEHLPPVQEYR